MRRILLTSSCAALLAAVGCSGGTPTAPSSAGATITGTVVRAEAPPAGMTVSVNGTSLSSPVDAAGAFRLGSVPTGDVQLAFGGSDPRPTVSLPNVADREVIELHVAIVGNQATVQREVRGSGAGSNSAGGPVASATGLVLCHRDNDRYRPLEVNPNDEQAHRAHGDARPGELVPADRSRVFDVDCRLISPVDIKKFTNGQDADQAPGPTIPVGSPVTWTYVITNRSALTLASMSVTDDRGVAVSCPRTVPAPGQSVTCTGAGVATAGQYRNVGAVTVTANTNSFTALDASHYFGGVVNGVTIEKFTNGEHVSQAPGPRIPVGSVVTWTYVVTNRTAFTFTSLTVTDDRGVAVACPRILPAPGQSLTCTGSGVAVAGQYRNVGTAVATANANTYTNSDVSFYFGGAIEDDEDEDEGSRKVQLCHRTGNGSYHSINVSVNAEKAHRGHGDGKVGEAVPGSPGRVFTPSCTVR